MPSFPVRGADDFIDMRCDTCGMHLGVRRRIGSFIFWCSDDCAKTPRAKFREDQIHDEVATELYLEGVPMMKIVRFVERGYQRIQQLLIRRGVALGQVPRQEKSA